MYVRPHDILESLNLNLFFLLENKKFKPHETEVNKLTTHH